LFSLIFKKEKIYLLGFIPMPALVGALVFVGLDLWGLFAQAKGGGLPIGHGAHLGGAFAGLIFYLIYARPRMERARLRASMSADFPST
jgi:membrane associated rhomboid family serine protease